MASEKRKRNNNNNDDRGMKTKKKEKEKVANEGEGGSISSSSEEQLRFLVDQFQAAKGVQLSSLELESLTADRCILERQHHSDDVTQLANTIKAAFGASWKRLLCDSVSHANIPAGSPALLILTSSALRSIHLLRGFRSMTKECQPVKLFSKHIKVEQQIALLKNRVNIASGTPSTIKKLIDIEALGLSRLQVLVLDMHPGCKGLFFILPSTSQR
uniref:Uncharacterized protein n=1 Tax=Lotus japonicus TaxID=34305 RepID=I3SH90_LOTJA|nr:unknown [Lotus japonicus]